VPLIYSHKKGKITTQEVSIHRSLKLQKLYHNKVGGLINNKKGINSTESLVLEVTKTVLKHTM